MIVPHNRTKICNKKIKNRNNQKTKVNNKIKLKILLFKNQNCFGLNKITSKPKILFVAKDYTTPRQLTSEAGLKQLFKLIIVFYTS